MKTLNLLILILCSTICFSQKPFEARLIMNDGNVLKGFIYKLAADDEFIRFLDSTGSVAQKINSSEVKIIIVSTTKSELHYENISVDGIPAFYRLLIDGPVKLYGLSAVDNHTTHISSYAVKRHHETTATKYSGLNFKKRMTAYFADDPATVDYIEHRPLLGIDLFELVHSYNKNREMVKS